MWKTTVKIDGMRCGMCESTVNQALRTALPVKKVTSSHRKGEAELLSDGELDGETVRAALDPTGYRVVSVECRPWEKKGRFGRGDA